MLDFTKLRKNLNKDYTGFKKIRIALLCDSSSQFLAIALRGHAYNEKIDLEIFEADYDQVDRNIFDATSDLYTFKPEFVVVSLSPYKLKKDFFNSDKQQKSNYAENLLTRLNNYYTAIQTLQSGCKVMFFNINELNDGVFGNYGNKTQESFIYQQRKFNYLLSELSSTTSNFYINDIALLQSAVGRASVIDYKHYVKADSIWDLSFLPLLAKNITDIILAASGLMKKCLILDLDNTTWGGIIGDDGVEGIEVGDLGIGKAYTELQQWAKQLKNRGIILCVCSKNDEHIAKEPFEKHEEMVLRLSDIAVFVANWETKVDNIHYIKNVLQIGYDSMVFIDDNPFERNMVRSAIPEMLVPELPEDPSDYVSYLSSLNLFETNSYTDEDEKRTSLYQEEAKRNQLQHIYKNEDEFLEKLNMQSEVSALNEFNIPRAAQLSQRSNQFNLRTVRYSEEDIKRISASTDYFSFVVSLKDNYGEYGIISIVILKRENENMFIETWLMSCRVLKRGVEKFVLNHIVECAKKENAQKIIGEYIPTAKNGMVKDHYEKLGFTVDGVNQWSLRVDSTMAFMTHINKSYQYEL